MKSLSYDITFAARKKEDFELWISALEKLQMETEKNKAIMLKYQNVESEKKQEDEARQNVKMS